MSFKTVSVIGLGYIGLPIAAMLASKEKKVIGVDINQHVVDTINRGEIHIVEPELDRIVRSAVNDGYLQAVINPEEADVFLIAVPTPLKDFNDDIPEPDVRYIEAAVSAIAPVLRKGNLVILESTSPVGTTEQIAERLARTRGDLSFPQQIGEDADINIAYCPERVFPGHVIRELIANDRVIGGMTETCSKRAIEFYKIFVEGECVTTNARTAEMVKLTENASRDVQIAFANELSVICDKLEMNVWELISLANRHPRVNILQPGPGVGGHCIAVDPWFIVSKTPDEAKIMHTARNVNDAKPEWVIKKVKATVTDFLAKNSNKKIEDICIACFGLAFKPNIDDLRESPALYITRQLADLYKESVIAVEPNIDRLSSKENFQLTSLEEAESSADIAVLLVDHTEFKRLGKPNIECIIDTKGIW